MRVTATDAKNRFGALCQQAKLAPVVVKKRPAGRTRCWCRVPTTSACWRTPHPAPRTPHPAPRSPQPAATLVARRRRQFNVQHKDWPVAHKQQRDAQGLWNDDLRRW